MLIERAQLYDELTTGGGLGATADGGGDGAGKRCVCVAPCLEDDSIDERSNS